MAAEPKLPTGGSRVAGSKFKVQGSKTLPSLPYEGRSRADAGYVLSVHDFCHDSANQASLLVLAAPKNQSCPQT